VKAWADDIAGGGEWIPSEVRGPLTDALALEEGDVVWVSKQPAVPEVSKMELIVPVVFAGLAVYPCVCKRSLKERVGLMFSFIHLSFLGRVDGARKTAVVDCRDGAEVG
jgi:hypothetical protein